MRIKLLVSRVLSLCRRTTVMRTTASLLLGVLLIAGSCARAQTSPNDAFSGEASGDDIVTTTTTPPPPQLVDCQRPLRGNSITFLEIFPCVPNDLVNVADCDVFTSIALIHVKRSINILNFLQHDKSLLSCFLIFPVVVETQGNDIEAVYRVTHIHNTLHTGSVQGIIGPSTSKEAQILSPLVTKLYKRPMISYGASRDLTGEEHRYFYTTIPTDTFLNRARIELMCRNNWRRIAVMSSSDETQSEAAADFVRLVSKNGSDICQFPTAVTANHFGAYTTSPDTILKRLQNDDFRIIFAFVEQERAGDLICRASIHNLTLTSRHVWILPGYYNHRWWKSNNNVMCNVSTAAQTVVFVDFNTLLIFPAEDRLERLFDDYGNIVNGTFGEFFLNTTVPADAYRFLYHSRALRAADAMIALANAWELALRDLLANYSAHFIKDKMEEYFKPDPDKMEDVVISKVQQKIRECVFVGAAGIYYFSKRDKNLGEAMITRFSDGKECLHGILANTKMSNIARENPYKCLNTTDFNANNFTFINVNEIHLNISDRDDHHFFNRSQLIMDPCESQNFPNDGNCYAEKCFCYRNVHKDFLALVGGLTIVVIALALLLLLINFILRNNKHVKASSPRLNIIIIIACIMMCPSAVLVGVEHAGPAIEEREFVLPPVCELRKWMFNIGFTLIIATMLTRNWRLYRIFYNKRMSVDMKFSTDRALLLVIALLVVPVAMTLTISSAIDHYSYNETSTLDPCPSLGFDTTIRTFRNQSSCDASYEKVWEGLMLGYNILLCCLLLFFAYQNSRIKTHFQQEGEFAAKAVVLVFLFVFLGTVVILLLNHRRENVNEYFGVNSVFVLGIPTAILSLLFVPKFVMVYMERRQAEQSLRKEAINKRFIEKYNTKRSEIQKLRGKLNTRENSISSLKHQLSKDQYRFRSNSTGPLISPDDNLPAIDGIVSSDIFESVFSSSRFSFASSS